MEISKILNQLGEDRSDYYGAIAPPLIQTSNFAFETVDDLKKAMDDERKISIYSRGNNPTVEILSKKVAALEHADEALVMASGMAAISSAVMANVKSGDHIICVEHCYSWTDTLLNVLLKKFNVSVTMVDGTDIENFKKEINDSTKIIYLESPNSFMFTLQDIEAISKFAHEKGIIVIVDNSYATPLSQSPITLGADLVVHSASKYLGGHSDVVAGIICGSGKMIEHIFESEYMTLGGIIAPFNAWLLIRSIRTLGIRVDRVSQTTEKVISFLKDHAKVKKIHYPFLEDHPQYDLAKKQMCMPMGMFSIELDTDTNGIERFCNELKYFLLACSWGGHESLIFPAYILSSKEEAGPYPDNLARLYIGFEDAEVLIKDLEDALALI